VILRLLVARVVGTTILRDTQLPRLLPLLPVRDILALGIFFLSFASNTIFWRGDRYRLKNGKLIRA